MTTPSKQEHPSIKNLTSPDADLNSSPTKTYVIGCCTKNNVCDLGPESCAPENHMSDCDRKSECDPG